MHWYDENDTIHTFAYDATKLLQLLILQGYTFLDKPIGCNFCAKSFKQESDPEEQQKDSLKNKQDPEASFVTIISRCDCMYLVVWTLC